MTTKILTGTYSAGYTLSPSFTGLKLTAPAYVGGMGVIASAPATVTNQGRILAAAGAAGDGNHYTGYSGNTGLDLASGGGVVNFAAISGGQGGVGYSGPDGNFGAGGAGGLAIMVSAAASIVNHSSIAGGAGGGGQGYGEGGGGGAGILVQGVATLANGGAIVGGSGGGGGARYFGASGGAGGQGVAFLAGGAVINIGTIEGGAGGTGGGGGFSGGTAYGGGGGSGGAGLILGGVGTLTNHGVIAGGRAGYGGGGYARNGNPGAGGDGVDLLDGGGIVNLGAIDGGATQSGHAAEGAGVVMSAGGSLTNGTSTNRTATVEGGIAIDAAGVASAMVTNFGTVAASAGDGVLLSAGGVIANAGAISGGTAGQYFVRGVGAYEGGAGGGGVVLQAVGTLTNSGGIAAGVGGAGADAGYYYGPFSPPGYYFHPGLGGRGGDGVDLLSGGGITNLGAIAGAAGGDGGAGGSGLGSFFVFGPGPGTIGGAGGAGVVLGAGGILSNSGMVVGGGGGGGGKGGSGFYSPFDGSDTYNGRNGGAGANGGDGVDLMAGGKVTNTATILAGAGGLGGAGGAGYRGGTNGAAGANGAAGNGVVLTAGGVLTNGSTLVGSALISGGIGVYAQGAGATVINYGTIAGATDSVKFASAGDVLIASVGAQFVGQIAGGGGALGWRGGAGTISGLGGAGVFAGTDNGAFSGFGTYLIGQTGAWALTGTNALNAGQSLIDNGAFVIDGSLNEAAGATINIATGAAIAFTGSGSVLAGKVGGLGSVAFAGGTDTLNGTTLSAAHVAISGASVTLQGTITTSGTVAVTTPALLIGAGGATLASGTWALSDSASNKVMGLAAGDTLNNASATISGAGMLGGGVMGLINRSAAVIDGNGHNALIIDTGANRVATSGLIEAVGTGGVTIQSAVLNAGKLEANGGTLTVNGAVSGPGTGLIASGALVFNAAFSENVTFSGASGSLTLAKSQGYAGSITGFSHTGGTSLDLKDIAFISVGEATFSGTATSGVLTVTDGTHTAKITLIGNYLGSAFAASSDGNGGVIVVDPPKTAGALQHRFIAAAAGLGGSAGEAIHTGVARTEHAPMLARPHAMAA